VARETELLDDLRDSFYALYGRECDVVFRYLRSALRDPANAEDLCGETHARAWDAWPRFRGGEQEARAWLMRIARNLVIDRVRRDGRLTFVPLPEHTAARDTGSAEVLALREAMSSLRRDDRELLAMRMAGLSHHEIAEIRHKSEAAIKKSWQRALTRVRAQLEVMQ